jgi:hypothetical protein
MDCASAESFVWTSLNPSRFVWGEVRMTEIDYEERAKRMANAFALLTAKLEDAAGLAADGQSPRTNAELQILTGRIADLGEEVAIIAGLLGALLPEED